jgi:two-component system cell cycle response regulator CtrA
VDVDARVEALEMENERLRLRVEELEAAMGMDLVAPLHFGLTGSQSRVLGVILARDVATKEAIMAALYEDVCRDRAEPKIVDVFACKLRAKLKKFGIEIATVWGVGYAMSPQAKALVREHITGAAA